MSPLLIALASLLIATFAFLWWLRRRPDVGSLPKSPVPWISHKVWRALGLQEVEEPGFPPIVHEAQVLKVSPDDQDRAPSLGAALPSPAPTSIEEALNALASVHGTGQLVRPIWPHCCGALAVLLSAHDEGTPLAKLEARVGSLDDAYLEEELAAWASHDGWRATLEEYRQGQHSGEGLFAYACAHCTKVYLCSGGPKRSR